VLINQSINKRDQNGGISNKVTVALGLKWLKATVLFQTDKIFFWKLYGQFYHM
jgi:hypothetical protein